MNNFFFTYDGKRVEANFLMEPIADYNVISVFVLDDEVAKVSGNHFHFIKQIHPGSYYQFAHNGSEKDKALKVAIAQQLATFNL